METTLNRIKSHCPCQNGWKKLLQYLRKNKADDEPLKIEVIIDSNGVMDAIWCLRAVDGHVREIRLFAVWCARQVQHLMTDQRSIAALDVAEMFANGDATPAELREAWARAWAAARGTSNTATWNASWAAVEAASGDAAWLAIGEAAQNSAEEAAWAAAEAAAWDAAGASAREVVLETAGAPAWAEAWKASWSVALDASRAAQKNELLRICNEQR